MVCTDLTGIKFGRLTVIERVCNDRKDNSQWLCSCSCGKEVIVRRYQLTSGKTKSCGCIRIENSIALGNTCARHGHYINNKSSKLAATWSGMKQRCYNSKDKNYRRYGYRGIKVCDRWLNSFEAFLNDVGEPPTSTHQLDRIDNNGNYEPTNCRWVTPKENANNRTVSHSKVLQMSCTHRVDVDYNFCPLCGMPFGNSFKTREDGAKAGVANG